MEPWKKDIYGKAFLEHSAKGTTWKKHKYIAIRNGVYIYPGDRPASHEKNVGVGTVDVAKRANRPASHEKRVGTGTVDVYKRQVSRPASHGKVVGTGTVDVHKRQFNRPASHKKKVGTGTVDVKKRGSRKSRAVSAARNAWARFSKMKFKRR